jgi:hypothetical protein
MPSRNHLLDQVESFRVGDRGSDREDARVGSRTFAGIFKD